ncbi:ribonuclease H-like domain-containing protein [Chaetomium sp. MPI-SDFR-AT-0129]|nr:ribonuclease H-like domain-containing protein [Chaetomium sp. MPI-SDFR-AT-0129]
MKKHGISPQAKPGPQLETALARLTIQDPQSGLTQLPKRPAFGTNGTPIILWANYFMLKSKVDHLYRYDVRVMPKKLSQSEEMEATTKKADDREIKGKKLAKIIELALKQLKGNPTYATEYKQQVITLQKLKLSEDSFEMVTLAEPPRKTETWYVRFDGPTSIDIRGLTSHLLSLEDRDNDGTFPKYLAEIDSLGVVFGHGPRSDAGTAAVGRSRFFAVDGRRDGAELHDQQALIDILRGYVQSVRPATGRLLLNTNVTHGVFRKEFALVKLFERFGLTDISGPRQDTNNEVRRNLDKLHRFLAKSRIRCKIPGNRPGEYLTSDRGMAGLAVRSDGGGEPKGEGPQFTTKQRFGTPATVQFFLRAAPPPASPPPPGLKANTMVTVADYYKSKYKNSNFNPNLPLINVGTSKKPIYFVAEQCTLLPGQPLKARLSPSEADSMIRFACRSAPQNAQSITTAGRALLKLDGNTLLDKFGLDVGKQLVTVKGRELTPPFVTYKQGSSPFNITPTDGGWLMKKVRVWQKGDEIKNWTYLVIHEQTGRLDMSPQEAVASFGRFLRNDMGVNMNMSPTPAAGYKTSDGSSADLKKRFEAFAKSKIQFVLVLLPSKDATLYNDVKKVGDVHTGIATVCVQQSMITKGKGQQGYFANVGLKVNLKFGGANHRVQDKTQLVSKTMFVGYDVTHPTNLPSGASDNAPSLVGLVSSLDENLAQWPAVAWEQKSRSEKVGDDKGKGSGDNDNNNLKKEDDNLFVENFKGRIRLWQRNNAGRLPDNIIIFRDGVSEGQFSMVINDELPHIRAACRAVYAANVKPPPITLIVSVKRHQTRFYPTDRNHMHPRSKSPKEGTIVDRGVTNVRHWDFFLQAHASLQGTARPAHYTVLVDEIFRANFGAQAANRLEELTHDMCYAYGRATKAVSICPPAYYADLVATRARVHKSEFYEDTKTVMSSRSGVTTTASEAEVAARRVHPNLVNSMYYI